MHQEIRFIFRYLLKNKIYINNFLAKQFCDQKIASYLYEAFCFKIFASSIHSFIFPQVVEISTHRSAAKTALFLELPAELFSPSAQEALLVISCIFSS